MIDKDLQAVLTEFRLDDTEQLTESEQGYNAWLAAGEVIERIKQGIYDEKYQNCDILHKQKR